MSRCNYTGNSISSSQSLIELFIVDIKRVFTKRSIARELNPFYQDITIMISLPAFLRHQCFEKNRASNISSFPSRHMYKKTSSFSSSTLASIECLRLIVWSVTRFSLISSRNYNANSSSSLSQALIEYLRIIMQPINSILCVSLCITRMRYLPFLLPSDFKQVFQNDNIARKLDPLLSRHRYNVSSSFSSSPQTWRLFKMTDIASKHSC